MPVMDREKVIMGDSNPYKKAIKPVYFGALDGFRGLLAIMIAIYHTIWLSHIQNTALFSNGPVLVDMFFVFSGFLMFTLYDGKISTGAHAKSFMKRRIARIYPLHFFMLMVAVVYAFARIIAHFVGLATYTEGEILPFQAGASDTIWSFLSNLTLTHSMGLHDSLSYNMPSWTVSVEFFAYFVFIGMMIFMRPKKLWHFIVLAVFIGVNYTVLSRLKPDMDFTYDLGFWRCLGGFFTGVIAAYGYRCLKPSVDKLQQVSAPRPFLVGATLFEMVVLSIMTGFVIFFPGKAQFFIAPVALIFVLGFSFDIGMISRIMSTKPMRYIAKISYSIYMVHVLIAIMFAIFAEKVLPILFGPLWNDTFFPGDLLLLPYLTIVLVCAHFTFKYIEMPGRNAIIAYDFEAKFSKFFRRKALGKA
jgi:peptidoglycan/LPS O-acetylase OafA/YrhL